MDHLDIDLFCKVYSEILSDHYSNEYGVDVTVKLTAIRKDGIPEKIRREVRQRECN